MQLLFVYFEFNEASIILKFLFIIIIFDTKSCYNFSTDA
jgi:hypothetical protein